MEDIIELAYSKPKLNQTDPLMDRLGSMYLDNLMAYVNGVKIKDCYTGIDREPNEKLMKDVEKQINVYNSDMWRHSIASKISHYILHHGKLFKWNDDLLLAKAINKKITSDYSMSSRHLFKTTGIRRVDDCLGIVTPDDVIDAEFEVRR